MAKKGPSSLGLVCFLLLALLVPWLMRINCVFASPQELHPRSIDGLRRKLIPVSGSCSKRAPSGRSGGGQGGGRPLRHN